MITFNGVSELVIGVSHLIIVLEIVWLQRARRDLSRGHLFWLVVIVFIVSGLANLSSAFFTTEAQTDIAMLRAAIFMIASLTGCIWLGQIAVRINELPSHEELRKSAATLAKLNLDLQQSNEVLQALINCAPLPIITLDTKGRVSTWNPAAERYFGWTKEEIYGHPLPIVPKRKKAEFAKIFAATQAGELLQGLDTKRRRKDGTLLDVRIWNAPLKVKRNDTISAMAIIEDIGERRRYMRALERAREAAEKANSAKTSFLAAVSHETRTPLLAIMNYADWLLQEPLPLDTQKQFIEVIKRNSEHLYSLISDILDVSAIETGHMKYEMAVTNFRSLFEEVLATLQPLANRKGISVNYYMDANFPAHVRTDPTRVRQVLYNMIGNAIKFTKQGVISASVDFDKLQGSLIRCVVRVSDSGIGISEDDAKTLFQPFVQVKSPVNDRLAGTGLGLFLSKKIANDLGGDVHLSRSVVSEGTTFEITLPLEAAS